MGKGAARWWHPLWLVWMVVERLTWLGTLGGGWTEATGVSADGSVVVGYARDYAGQARAFRWTEAGGMEDLNITYAHLLTNGSVLSSVLIGARAISPDGRYIVGLGYNAATRRIEAFLLDTQGTGVEERLIWLGTLGGSEGWATGVSADGSVVVGEAENAAGQRRAFRWTEARGMQDLGTLGGRWSEARGVSADGSVVVGGDWNAAWQQRAFRWTAAGGMEDLNITYAHLLTDGSELWAAYAVSPDGRYIVGYGRNAAKMRIEAFLLEGSGAARVRLRLLPQPAHERVALELEVAEAAGRVTLMVSDVLGRVVAEPLREAVLPPGVHRVELDVRAWAAGQYTVVLHTEAGSTAVLLAVVR